MDIVRYEREKEREWNEFLKTAKNSMFLFHRNYMEYHKDRFEDHSLMIYDDNKLVALFPATISVDNGKTVLNSHGGLTFGGYITNSSMKQHRMNRIVLSMCDYLREKSINSLIYKEIPHIYHVIPAEEDEYGIFWHGAKIVKMESSTVIKLNNRIKMPKGRKAQISRAKREGVIVNDSEDYKTYIDLENEVLKEYHNSIAVHTGDELKMLHDRFPGNIRLVAGMHEGKMIAGVVLYIFENTVRTQYMAANDTARQIGALDLVVSEVLNQYEGKKEWFDFGKSTEGNGSYLNEGLISQKEGFGGRTVNYRTWKLMDE